MLNRSLVALRRSVAAATFVVALAMAAQVQAVVVYSEDFSTNTANALVTYPDFTLYNGTSASVSGGVLNLTSNGGNSYAVNIALPSAWEMEVDLSGTTASTNIGSDAVGMRIGNYSFIFFPGYPGGALQIRLIDGNGAPNALVVPDQSIGFTPATNVLHHMKASIVGQQFTFEFTNGASPFEQSVINFTAGGSNPLYVPGPIGFAQINSLTGLYDNFVVDDLTVLVPEPSTFVLLGCGSLGLVVRRRRQRGAN